MSDTLYDAQAGYQANIYAGAWAQGAPAAPPPIPSITQEVLRVSVNASGYTVINASAREVWAAVNFPNGLLPATHSICGVLIDSIIAAG